jgi:hypothetical protein
VREEVRLLLCFPPFFPPFFFFFFFFFFLVLLPSSLLPSHPLSSSVDFDAMKFALLLVLAVAWLQPVVEARRPVHTHIAHVHRTIREAVERARGRAVKQAQAAPMFFLSGIQKAIAHMRLLASRKNEEKRRKKEQR